MKKTSLLITLLITTTLLSNAIKCLSTTIAQKEKTYHQSLIVDTIYGSFEVVEPVLIELFNSTTMERIKHVLQYGVSDYVIKQNKKYTRYEHCVGVWALLRMYGATLEEQIAGLLHDASHTVFSHVGDVLFNHRSPNSSYQDDIHEWYLKQQKIDLLLHPYHLSLETILHKNGAHKMLEQNLPDICADRLEYNLQAGIKTGMLTVDDIATILKDIHYENGNWYFTNVESAKKLGFVSLFNTEFVWGGPEDHFIYRWTADALKRALTIGLLTTDDIHFSTDAIVWSELWTSNDPIIIDCLDKIIHYKKIIVTTTPEESNLVIKSKFRGLNPLIKIEDTFKRLTDLDVEYRKEYERVKKQVTDGWNIQLNF
jgi:hypothetical protein